MLPPECAAEKASAAPVPLVPHPLAHRLSIAGYADPCPSPSWAGGAVLFLGRSPARAAPPTPAHLGPTGAAVAAGIPIRPAGREASLAPGCAKAGTHPQRLLLAGKAWAEPSAHWCSNSTLRRHGPGQGRRSELPLSSAAARFPSGSAPPTLYALGAQEQAGERFSANASRPSRSALSRRRWGAGPQPGTALLEGALPPGARWARGCRSGPQ